MLRLKLSEATFAAAVVAFMAGDACARDFIAKLNGFEELGGLNAQTGAVLSNATGTATIELEAGMVTYRLTYSNVGMTSPNTGNVSQAHIHFGKSRDSGGVMVFFCTNMGNAPAGTSGAQPCPAHSGTVTGFWTAASVVGIAGQNVVAGDFNALVQALNSDTAYANIHTTPGYPAGEIRGQVHREDGEDGGDR